MWRRPFACPRSISFDETERDAREVSTDLFAFSQNVAPRQARRDSSANVGRSTVGSPFPETGSREVASRSRESPLENHSLSLFLTKDHSNRVFVKRSCPRSTDSGTGASTLGLPRAFRLHLCRHRGEGVKRTNRYRLKRAAL